MDLVHCLCFVKIMTTFGSLFFVLPNRSIIIYKLSEFFYLYLYQFQTISSDRLGPLEKGTPCPGYAQHNLQGILCATTPCLNRREHGRHEEPCRLIQYMPNKRYFRFGIKKFELCDALRAACGTVCREGLSTAVR